MNYPLFINITLPISYRAAGQKRQQQGNTAMEVAEDVCGSEGVCEVMCDVPSNAPQHEESMETHMFEEEATRFSNSGSVEEDADCPGAGRSIADASAPPSKPRFSYRWDFWITCNLLNTQNYLPGFCCTLHSTKLERLLFSSQGPTKCVLRSQLSPRLQGPTG